MQDILTSLFSISVWAFIFVSFGYLLVKLIKDPEADADLEKIRPVFGNKHLGIILSAWIRLIAIGAVFALYVGSRVLIHDFLHKPDTLIDVLGIIQEVAGEHLIYSYGSEYAVEQYTHQNLYEYRNYQRYINKLQSQKDFTDFNRWLASGRSEQEIKVELSRYIRLNCNNYVDVYKLVSQLYKRFRAEYYNSKRKTNLK